MTSRALFIYSIVLISLLYSVLYADPSKETKEGRRVVITSETFTADNKSNTAIFEGTVVATIKDITIHSDRMTIYYDGSRGSIEKIHATGSVRVHRGGSAIFSDDATYLGNEEKIVFTGEPKLVDGENVVTGTRIIYFLKDDRAIVEGSRVVLKLKGGKDNALFRDKRD
jgi:lipopolysaccharide export system protein LptA